MNRFKFVFAFVSAFISRLFNKRSFSNWSLTYEAKVAALRTFTHEVSRWSARSQRLQWDLLANKKHPLLQQVELINSKAGGCDCLTVKAKEGPKPDKAVFYIHGGSFEFGSVATHTLFAARLTHHTGAEVTLPEYSLAPEYQFPYQINQLSDAFREFCKAKRKSGQRVFLAGDGAGGNLALALLQQLSDKEIDDISGMLLISPWGDLSQLGDTLISHAKYDWLTPKLLQHWIYQYLELSDVKDTLASPFLARYKRFPRTYLTVGSAEMLFSQVDHFFARNARYHLPIQYVIAKNMVHGWALFDPNGSESLSLFKQLDVFMNTPPVAKPAAKLRSPLELAH